MKNDHLTTVVKLLAAFLVISVSTVVAVVLMRHNPALVTPAVWVRTPLVAASAAVLLLFARRAAAGHRASFRRLRIISMVVLAAIIAVVAWPGAFPVWLRVEQAVCGVFMLSVVARTNLRVVRSSMQAGSGESATTPAARQ
jgi:small-conductance mechanosensitive channel